MWRNGYASGYAENLPSYACYASYASKGVRGEIALGNHHAGDLFTGQSRPMVVACQAVRLRNNCVLKMRKHLIFASALTLFPLCAQAATSTPNDCWFGVMALDQAPHGQLVARGPVAQWRVGMSLVLYPTKEDYAQVNALAEKGETATFDTSHAITVIPTWISGPEPGNKASDEDKDIQIMMKYRNAQGEPGTIALTLWTPMSGQDAELPPERREAIAQADQQLHDINCRGIP